METIQHSPENIFTFKNKALQWAASFETACCFDSNSYPDPYSAFDVLIAAGTESVLNASPGSNFENFKNYLDKDVSWKCGFLSYDLKNEIENLGSSNLDYIQIPELFFFQPQHLIKISDGLVEITSKSPAQIIDQIHTIQLVDDNVNFYGKIESRISRDEYIQTVKCIQDHIKRGDIYEMTFCQEFYAADAQLSPLAAYKALNMLSPTPFAAFFKHKHHSVISASPERFLCKRASKLISQPIKGTAPRNSDPEKDFNLKTYLRNSIKEQSENVMIVDLVRNDLTRCSMPGSVKVEELFGIYSFKQVHQMISTVVSNTKPDLDNVSIIKHTFPMGSMTGAPKIRAMELIEKFEVSKRGLFSGTVGYFSPDGDFDFNVIIRTILYNTANNYLSFQVGSAITYASDPEKEYEECLLKAEAIRKVLLN